MEISNKGWIAIIAIVAYIAFMGGMSWQDQNQDPKRKIDLGNGIVSQKTYSNQVGIRFPEENTTINEYNQHIEVILNPGMGEMANRTIWVGTYGGGFIAQKVYAISIYANETRGPDEAPQRIVSMTYSEWNKTLNDPLAAGKLWAKLYPEEQVALTKQLVRQRWGEHLWGQNSSVSYP